MASVSTALVLNVSPLAVAVLAGPDQADEPGHSASRALEDSPGGVYRANRHDRVVVKVDFSNVQRPLLRFKHRFQFDEGDYATVSYAEADGFNNPASHGQTTEVGRFTGTSLAWRDEAFDLGAFNAHSESRTGFLVFEIYTDAQTGRDGWHLDDIEVTENTATASYPFFDDVEDAGATFARWTEGTARRIETGEGTAYSGTHVWQVHRGSPMLLGGSVDLTEVANPYLSFWVRGSQGSAPLLVEVSTDDGDTWRVIHNPTSPTAGSACSSRSRTTARPTSASASAPPGPTGTSSSMTSSSAATSRPNRWPSMPVRFGSRPSRPGNATR